MNQAKQTYYLTSEAILKYLLNTSDKIDTLITCKGSEVHIATTDFNLYEALGSVKEEDNIQLNRLTKFLEVVRIEPGAKRILTHERVEELRAMKGE